MFNDILNFIREIYGQAKGVIPLHAPVFMGNEKKYVNETIDSTFVSSIGKFVDQIEDDIAQYTGADYAIATVNGTSALHMALILAGVEKHDLVITQPLTFVATCNAIAYCGANPVFVDVDRDTMGLSPIKVEEFLDSSTFLNNQGECIHTATGKRIRACVPMHTFGHPCKIDEIVKTCQKYNISVVEDSAESLGSLYKNKHTGTFGLLGVFSFNGNKIVTCGGGGIIITNDAEIAKRGKHLTTTAKISHQWKYVHDEVGYNYRMPNLNAAMACAQLEQVEKFVKVKRELAARYHSFFSDLGVCFALEPAEARSNYWLNSLILEDLEQRNNFLKISNNNGVITRPAWGLISNYSFYSGLQFEEMDNAKWLEERVVNIPSSVLCITCAEDESNVLSPNFK